jgi:hypothetical protein
MCVRAKEWQKRLVEEARQGRAGQGWAGVERLWAGVSEGEGEGEGELRLRQPTQWKESSCPHSTHLTYP